MSVRNVCLSLTRNLFSKRGLSTSASPAASQFADLAAAESSKFQIFLSSSTDPYLNLSIEHHLLQTTPTDAVVLFLYANRPCVVIGRNQNPWLETDLRRLQLGWEPSPSSSLHDTSNSIFSALPPTPELVRRRSGGGAVFHGPGNINYSVIVPASSFARDIHAHMVASALRELNSTAHVNARHDIVLIPDDHVQAATTRAHPGEASPPDPSAAAAPVSRDTGLRKISGSAFKLTRSRALHHGTCLLCTPHLRFLGQFLRSPAASYLKAAGVDSVPSPVANVLPPAGDAAELATNVRKFHGAALRAFAALYPAASLSGSDIKSILDAAERSAAPMQRTPRPARGTQDPEMLSLHSMTIAGIVGPGCATLPGIASGIAELRSPAWLFGQTPRFTLSTHLTAERTTSPSQSTPAQQSPALPSPPDPTSPTDPIHAPSRPPRPQGVGVYLQARNGAVTSAALVRLPTEQATISANSNPPSNSAGDAKPLPVFLHLEAVASASEPVVGSLALALKGQKLWTMDRAAWASAMAEVRSLDGDEAVGRRELDENGRAETGRWLADMLPLPRNREEGDQDM